MWSDPSVLAEDPLAYWLVHMLKYSGDFRKFTQHDNANLLKNIGWASGNTMWASTHRVAMGSQCHVTQHHHPACKPLLVGGNGGADNEWHHREGLMNTGRIEQTMTITGRMATNDGEGMMQGWQCKGDKWQCGDNNTRPTMGAQCMMPILATNARQWGCFFFSSFFFLLAPPLWAAGWCY